jgi:hypothetical protein
MTKLKYTPEIRERAVQLVIESEKDYPSNWAAITAIAPKIGCTPETLRVWHHLQIPSVLIVVIFYDLTLVIQNEAFDMGELTFVGTVANRDLS